MTLKLSIAALLLCGQSVAAVDVGNAKQLFLDNQVVDSLDHVSRIFHQGVKSASNPVLVPVKPWEGQMVDVGTVIYDEQEHLFKMWYAGLEIHYQVPARPFDQYENLLRASKYTERFHLCYATSKDGIHWDRPELGLVEFEGSRKNNLVHVETAGGTPVFIASLFKDVREKNPLRRYKGVTYWKDKAGRFGVGVYFSPDGLRWSPYAGNPAVSGTSDVHQLLGWDERIGKYVGYFRPGQGPAQPDYERLSPPAGKLRVRTIGYSVSDDFEHWTPIEAALIPDEQDPVDAQFYGMPAMKYEGHYIGFPWVFRTNEITHVPQLAFSRDGRHFSRTPGRGDFIPLGPTGAFDDANVYSSRPVVHDGRIWVYYSGGRWRGMLDLFESEAKARDAIGLATLPLDGFASLQAGPNPGVVTTKALRFQGSRLEVNLEASVKGYSGVDETTSLAVELLDESGQPIPGYSQERADRFSRSNLSQVITWSGRSDVSALSGKPVRLRFHLRNVKLYAFQFR